MAADVEVPQDGAAPDQQGQQASGGPRAQAESMRVAASEASERGRYAVFVLPDGGWKIATAGPLCETCASCGCGQAYRDPVPVPPFAVQVLTGGGMSAVPAPLRAMLGKVMGNGRG